MPIIVHLIAVAIVSICAALASIVCCLSRMDGNSKEVK